MEGDPKSGRRPGGILIYGMYDVSVVNSAPRVRITMMSGALSRHAHTEVITGGRFGRAARAFRWLVTGGFRRVDGVYVESATTSSMPTDLLFLLAMRLLRKRVGVYFRDAYQLYRDFYPRRGRRQILADWLWRITTPILALIATHRFAASAGLGRALKLRKCVPLGPGADPSMPDLGAGSEPLVAYVGSHGWADGYQLLLDAMAIVHERCPEARLRLIGPAIPEERWRAMPDYIEQRLAGRDELAGLLRAARVCVIPRPITAYSNLALPIKLQDYLSLGKPVVATAATETEGVLAASGAGIATPDTPEGLAAGLLQPLLDMELARRLAANARAYACSPAATWDARALSVLTTLRIEPAASNG